MNLRLVALDLDGTLLDPFAKLTPSVREAVQGLKRHGLDVVLCTGRRFRTALPLALELELEGSIVVNNGVVVKDIASGATLQSAYLDPRLVGAVIDQVRHHGSPLLYVDRYHEGVDIVTERLEHSHAFQREYVEDQSEFLQVHDDVTRLGADDVIMVSTMADELSLDTLRRGASARLGEHVYTHAIQNKNYQGSILEFLSPAAGKWRALEKLAESRGIAPAEIAAVGDDVNDAEMLDRAGLGIAMGNAVPAAREGADLVVSSNAEGGAVEAIEAILARA